MDAKEQPWQGGHLVGGVHLVQQGRAWRLNFQLSDFALSKSFHIQPHQTSEEVQRQAEELRLQINKDQDLIKNQWRRLQDGTIEMRLSKGQTCVFDEEDLEKVQSYVWAANAGGNTFYAYAHVSNSTAKVSMHRLICPQYPMVDHKDRNGLNNCRSNLRDGSNGVNGYNKSLRKDNVSGENGISPYKEQGVVVGWQVRWYDENKVYRGKNFCWTYSTKKRAFREAIEFRDQIYSLIGNTNGKRRMEE